MNTALKILTLCSLFAISACTSRLTKDALIKKHSEILHQQTQQLAEQSKMIADLSSSHQEASDELAQKIYALEEQLKTPGKRASAVRHDSTSSADASGEKDPKDIPAGLVSNDSSANSASLLNSEKAMLGYIEWVYLAQLSKNFKARVDTGAKSSSIHAENIQPFERDGEKWVRFSIVLDDVSRQRNTQKTNGKSKANNVFEAPLVRHVKIRQASADDLDHRPVITLRVRVGDIEDDTQFTLNDRKNMLYPVLLGRSFLQDIAIVDVAKKFTQKKYKKPMEKPTSQL